MSRARTALLLLALLGAPLLAACERPDGRRGAYVGGAGGASMRAP